MTGPVSINLDELRLSPCGAVRRCEGKCRNLDLRRPHPPGRFVALHTHPYSETFVLLEGHARWSAGEEPA